MAAFVSTDARNKGVLGQNSVRTLLWLVNNKEPNERKVNQETALVSWEDGMLTVKNWIHYLLCTSVKGVIVGHKAKEEFDLVIL